MKESIFQFSYRIYQDQEELPGQERLLLEKAREATSQAYAPYSGFRVGAAARMENGEYISGSNQENASFPVGMCAERVLLGAISSAYPGMAAEAIAITYETDTQESDHPISPCGLCRQSLLEYESRTGKPLQIILGGRTGPVFVIESAGSLLPLAFTSRELT